MQKTILIFTALVAAGFLSMHAVAGELKAFTSDGCSAFPDGTHDQQALWLECCIHHDLAYWKGGTKEERRTADKALQQCVAKVGEPEIAKIMLAGVRVGGSPYFPTSYRWGYGWPYTHGYDALTVAEKAQVKNRLRQLQLMLKNISDELNRP